MRSSVLFLMVVTLLVCPEWIHSDSLAYADIPKMINFQGRLTDSAGKFVTDGNYSLTFRIYTDSTGGTDKWTETQIVAVSKGLFNAILGSITPIPDSIFNSPNTWLGIQVERDPEMTPRQRLSSLGYAYRGAKADSSIYSKDSDKLDGFHASDFASIGTDYGRSGVAPDLYEGTTKLTDKYVNSAGPDSVYTSSGIAFLGKSSGTSASAIYGIQGYGDNSSSGVAAGGYFSSSTSGTGNHYGVFGLGLGSSSASAYGSYGFSANTSSGSVYGGYFETSSSGIGGHLGVLGVGNGSSSATTRGAEGDAFATSTGDAVGIFGSGNNSSSGNAYGGYFYTSSGGSGTHFGVSASGYGSSDSATYGIKGFGDNSSTGSVYAGHFSTSSSGTGTHIGVEGDGFGSSSANTYGAYGYADNTSSGGAIGGYFTTTSSGTGNHFGVMGQVYGASPAPNKAYGSYAVAQNTSTGDAIGSLGQASNFSSGDAYGGVFNTASVGTGWHYGVSAAAYGTSSAPTYGSYGYASNTSTGTTYGGNFYVSPSGTGTHYGVWAYELSGGSGAAVYASGDFVASGTKNAVLKTSKGQRLMSVIESPEVWFEDFGEGQLVNGKTHIELDPLFLETVTINNSNLMKVFVQLEGDCNGVYVVKGTSGFDVNELKSGTSNVTFSYRVVAKRKGYENERMRETDVGKDDPNLYPELRAEIEKKHQQEQAQLEEERNKTEQQSLEMEKNINSKK